ncbi:hypothetical protein A5686_06115 [Mycobacterium sp. E2479]|nr:hypothetical protein A5686_06115 [Mycobacterium sp. E2479]
MAVSSDSSSLNKDLGFDDLSSEQARQLARALNAAAGDVDRLNDAEAPPTPDEVYPQGLERIGIQPVHRAGAIREGHLICDDFANEFSADESMRAGMTSNPSIPLAIAKGITPAP